ncbi:hypothetical protein HK096_008190, partial [Nowakowskiella sp. JEL0078]
MKFISKSMELCSSDESAKSETLLFGKMYTSQCKLNLFPILTSTESPLFFELCNLKINTKFKILTLNSDIYNIDGSMTLIPIRILNFRSLSGALVNQPTIGQADIFLSNRFTTRFFLLDSVTG